MHCARHFIVLVCPVEPEGARRYVPTSERLLDEPPTPGTRSSIFLSIASVLYLLVLLPVVGACAVRTLEADPLSPVGGEVKPTKARSQVLLGQDLENLQLKPSGCPQTSWKPFVGARQHHPAASDMAQYHFYELLTCSDPVAVKGTSSSHLACDMPGQKLCCFLLRPRQTRLSTDQVRASPHTFTHKGRF